jgi:hypothetical protein
MKEQKKKNTKKKSFFIHGDLGSLRPREKEKNLKWKKSREERIEQIE